jgi:hypothetical protein
MTLTSKKGITQRHHESMTVKEDFLGAVKGRVQQHWNKENKTKNAWPAVRQDSPEHR